MYLSLKTGLWYDDSLKSSFRLVGAEQLNSLNGMGWDGLNCLSSHRYSVSKSWGSSDEDSKEGEIKCIGNLMLLLIEHCPGIDHKVTDLLKTLRWNFGVLMQESMLFFSFLFRPCMCSLRS